MLNESIDGELPNGPTWHKDLLWLMTKDKPDVRPAIISRDVAMALDDFRRFRHIVRNVYTMSLVPEKMSPLTSALERLWPILRAELSAFADFVEALGNSI